MSYRDKHMFATDQITSYRNKRVTVVGLGREGRAVTRVLAAEGAHVTVSDSREAPALAEALTALEGLEVRLSLGGHRPDEALDCDALVLSPGVDKRIPLVQEALRRGIPISSETALFLARCPAPIIGVTGSAGKTTTTTLIGEMLRGSTRPVFVGGNIGRPLLERLHEISADAWVVLELSSFQLEWLRASPPIAVVTNITPNHLDRHETMEAYTAAKATILAYQSSRDVTVLNQDDPGAAALAARAPGRVLYFSLTRAPQSPCGAFLDGDTLALHQHGRPVALCRADELRVPGRHNVANALAAATVAALCDIAPSYMAATLRRFSGVPHRLQLVGAHDGVSYYNDSIATAPERTLAALAALDGPLVLLLGGRDKHLPWEDLARAAVRRCRGIVLIGEAAPLIRRHLETALAEAGDGAGGLLNAGAVVGARNMAEAVRRAAQLARPGDAVALSPGCTSYDMYQDYAQRGDDFARAVRRLESDV